MAKVTTARLFGIMRMIEENSGLKLALLSYGKNENRLAVRIADIHLIPLNESDKPRNNEEMEKLLLTIQAFSYFARFGKNKEIEA